MSRMTGSWIEKKKKHSLILHYIDTTEGFGGTLRQIWIRLPSREALQAASNRNSFLERERIQAKVETSRHSCKDKDVTIRHVLLSVEKRRKWLQKSNQACDILFLCLISDKFNQIKLFSCLRRQGCPSRRRNKEKFVVRKWWAQSSKMDFKLLASLLSKNQPT